MQVFAFGSNLSGECGLGAGELGTQRRCRHVTLPMPVTTLAHRSVVHVAAGAHSSFAVDAGGRLWAWGNNDHGQLVLGHGKRTDIPHRLPLPPPPSCTNRTRRVLHPVLIGHAVSLGHAVSRPRPLPPPRYKSDAHLPPSGTNRTHIFPHPV